MNRNLQRDWVFKYIYQDNFNQDDDYKKFLMDNDIKSFDFLESSISSYIKNRDYLSKLVEDNINQNINRLNKVESSILYLSLNEMVFLKIPVSVSINEAVNLAKKYGDESCYKKINKILGDITRKENLWEMP